MNEALPIWVITRNPSDYPGLYVVREQRLLPDGTLWKALRPHSVTASLEAARSTVPEGLALLARHPDDDPVIAETWL